MDCPASARVSASLRASQAVILAAGRGSRMGASTANMPKCLSTLGGRPLLAWTLDALRACGIEDVLIVGGWQHQELTAWSPHLVVNTHWASTNMVRSLECADAWLRRAGTLVVYGDGAYGPTALAAALGAPHADLLVPGDRLWRELWSLRFEDPLADAETWQCDGRRLLSIGAPLRTLGDADAQFMGLVRLAPEGWQTVCHGLRRWEVEEGSTAIDKLDVTGLLARLIGAGVVVHCHDVHGGWVEIDSERDREVVEQALGRPGFHHDFRN